MKALKLLIFALLLVAVFFGVSSPAAASMWDDPKNLKALPEDITPGELRSTMRSFALGTGSRCSTCHVGKVETDLRTYDFSLDEKEKKLKARAMILMVKNINEYLSENLSEYSPELITVNCATCHRGQAKPDMIEDLLVKIFRDDGLEMAIVEYRKLRDQYFGGYAFDFSPQPLNMLAENIARESDFDAALRFLELNIEFNPESVRAYQLQGDVWKAKNNTAAALVSYEKALELAPDNAWTQRLIKSLEAAN